MYVAFGLAESDPHSIRRYLRLFIIFRHLALTHPRTVYGDKVYLIIPTRSILLSGAAGETQSTFLDWPQLDLINSTNNLDYLPF